MRIRFVNEKALAPMLRDVMWQEDGGQMRRGTFAAQVLEGESQSESAGPTRLPIAANPWTVRVPPAAPGNALAALVEMGDTLTVAPSTVLTVQQVTRALEGYLVIRCTADMRAPINP